MFTSIVMRRANWMLLLIAIAFAHAILSGRASETATAAGEVLSGASPTSVQSVPAAPVKALPEERWPMH